MTKSIEAEILEVLERHGMAGRPYALSCTAQIMSLFKVYSQKEVVGELEKLVNFSRCMKDNCGVVDDELLEENVFNRLKAINREGEGQDNDPS